MKAFNCSVLAAAAALGAAGAASAQTSRLYMQDGEPYNDYNTQVRVAQGGSVVQTFDLNSSQEHNIVVAGDIRTYAGNHSGTPGYQYNLNGGYLGNQYNNGPGYPSDAYYGPDAATDGTSNNWIWDYGYSTVVRFDRNYQNGSFVGNFGGGIGGITWDGDDNSLWTFSANQGAISHSDLNGNVSFSFGIPNAFMYQALALDPADDTLWLLQGRGYGNGWLQYDRNGQLLNSGDFGWSPITGGAEFDVLIPAPGAAALLGVGGLVAARRRRA